MEQLKKLAYAEKKTIVTLVIISILIAFSIIGQAYFVVTIVDKIFLKGHSFQDVIPLLGALLLVFFVRAMLIYLNGRTGVKMASKVKRGIRMTLLHNFSTNPIQASLTGQSGRKVSVMMDAVDEIDSYFSKYIPQMIQTMIVPLIVLIIIFSQHMYTGLIILFTAPFIPIFMIIIGIKTKKKSDEQMEKMTAFSGRFLDTLQGLTTLKLFGRSAQQKEGIRKSSLDFRDATMEVLKVAFLSSLMLEFISMLSIGIIALEIGFRLIVFDSISFFAAFFVLVLVPEFFLSLKDLGSAFHTGRSSMSAAKLVMEELVENESAMQWDDNNSKYESTPPSIELNGMGFTYGENRFALKNIQAEIPPYGQVAIVGRSGSGKTTLLHVIAGLVGHTEGEILVNGRSRSDYNEKEWFDQLSYISQQPYLFSGTIEENIVIGGNRQVTRLEVEEAAKKAGISEMIESLKQGYDTPIGEAGRGLSGGEKQRIAIARAFLKRPSIILFDEPTTGLDLQTEQILQASIKELSKYSTVITVAHRLHTIKNADKILFLTDGNLWAEGTHTELINSVEEYRNMVSVQKGGDTQ
ncbi:thiol reductant ABC exporter subunit CydD [Paenisporosarcina antarctica]|uniref:Thiol reductant ABC exporter subunit CydD n=1 Tax=Paenisporosarcina antarctica TaxID=417367 RepID=A0A4P6ZXY0_9BACL|nr:thiol reductant ABC exporter subunit CydD [Paenisporosarcina antarctica]QBP41292.1 thiol reductant ABC exporter subunit CydD [Paenisporosarcina antarctica]